MTGTVGAEYTWMGRLREAAESGEVFDLAPGLADDNADPPTTEEGMIARQLPAEDIRALLLEPGLVIDPRGLQFRGVLVSGTLDLDHAILPCRLVFSHCRFENAPSFKRTSLPELVLEDVVLPHLLLRSTRLAGNCTLSGLRSEGEVDATNVYVGGQLNLTGAKLINPDGIALSLDGAEIAGGAFLAGMEATGEVRALGACFNGELNLIGAKLTSPDGISLNVNGAEIIGGAFMQRLEASGEVRAISAHISGQLNLTAAKLTNPDGIALSLDGAQIVGGAFMQRLEAAGEIRAISAHISGQLNLTAAKLTNPDGDTLSLDGAEIIGDAGLEGLEVTGEVRALGARIKGQLNLIGAKLKNPDGDAQSLDGAEISGGAFMQGLEATGEVRALSVHIKGQLNLIGAKLTNPDGVALSLQRAEVIGSAFLRGVEGAGEIRVLGAHIMGELGLTGAKLTNPDGIALNLANAALDTVILDDAFSVEGRVSLSFVSIRVLAVGTKKSANGLPLLSDAHSWTLGTVHGFLRTDRKSARDWLDTVATRPQAGGRMVFASQPWKEMAKVYDQIGQPEDGRRLRFWAARRTTQAAPWTSKLVRWPYAALVGYGYYPALTLGWLCALWVAVLLLCCFNAQAFTPTDPRASTVAVSSTNQPVRATGATATPLDYPSFNAALFAVDTALPAAATGQALAWRVTESARVSGLFAAIKGFAWLLTALLLAGVTGLLRRD